MRKSDGQQMAFNFYKNAPQPEVSKGQNISVINYNNPTINMNFNSNDASGQNSIRSSLRSKSNQPSHRRRKQTEDERF